MTEVPADRPRVRRWIDVDVARRYIDAITMTVELMSTPTETDLVIRDPGDDYLTVLARASEADFTVSDARHPVDWPEQRPPGIAPTTVKLRSWHRCCPEKSWDTEGPVALMSSDLLTRGRMTLPRPRRDPLSCHHRNYRRYKVANRPPER